MFKYNSKPIRERQLGDKSIAEFGLGSSNIDLETVNSFGEEWNKFDQFSEDDLRTAGDQYFDIVDEDLLNVETTALDLGCGSGRWTRYIADKVGFVEAVDPSEAIYSAAITNKDLQNVRFTRAGVDTIPFEDNSFDFVMSLGVLHHIPDTEAALKSLIKKLKPEGYALIYLYYALDNRGFFYKLLFHFSTLFRRIISSFPKVLKQLACDFIAVFVYLPFVGLTKLAKVLFRGKLYMKVPLAYYRDKSWNIIRNDALDRFGTPLEQRFSKAEISAMMVNAGMEEIRFSENEPYWHVIGRKKK